MNLAESIRLHQNYGKSKEMPVLASVDKCSGCSACYAVCPEEAIKEYAKKIDDILKNNELVIAFDDEYSEIRQIHKGFLESKILKYSNKKILILELKRNEQELFLELYRLYEFSDRVHYVSNNTQFGTLLNYLKTGIITKDELYESLLY